jgi:hypothetical protein
MSERDPIASPTLALLYLAQGHFGRAHGIVEQLLARDPTDGQALVLARRLAARGSAHISCEARADRLTLAWQGAPATPQTHVVWMLTGVERGITRVRVSSTRCDRSFGSVDRPVPWPRGAVSCCIARVDARDGFVPLAVGPACTWG